MSESMNQAALDLFGEMLVTRVRENAIFDWGSLINGRMKGETAEQLRPVLSKLNSDEKELILQLIPRIVDTTLHHLLWTLEQSDSVAVRVRLPAGVVPDLKEVSDGLAGELYDWIPRFEQGSSNAN